MNTRNRSYGIRFENPRIANAALAIMIFVFFHTIVLAEKLNTSYVKVENGVPKLVINDQIINNIFGIYVYCTDIDPNRKQFLEEMKKVIIRTKDLDIPVLSFDILWSDYDHSITIPKNAEEAAKRFNTENLDAVLDYAARNNVYVVVQLLVHDHWGLPRWWKDFKNNNQGYQLIDRISDPSDVYNRLQNPVASYQGDTHRELLQALINKLVKRYRNHPAVVGWGINLGPTGENGYAPNYIDILFNRRLPDIDFRLAMADYSDMAVERFRQWLTRRYGNINKLNQVWESEHKAFEKIFPPIPKRITTSDTFEKNGDGRQTMGDWQLFRYEALIDEWKFLSNFIRRLDPNKIIMGKTSWVPVGTPTGTENMMATAEAVNEQYLIEADKIDVGITMRDYMPDRPLWSSIIDYIHFAKFSRKHNVVRIINLENWVKIDPTLSRSTKIPLKRSMLMKEAIREEGAYLWLTVSLDSDHGKPSWSWNEIKELVRHSNANELQDIKAKKPSVLFYYDVNNLLSHYFEEQGNLQASKLYYNISRAFFDVEGQPVYGFISAKDVARELFNAKINKLIILANQRILSSETIKGLYKYITDGGTILLVGSNGIFNTSSQKDNLMIKKLAPKLTEDQIRYLYTWGLQRNIQVPLIIVSNDVFHFTKIPLLGKPSENYQILKSVLSKKLILAEYGNLALAGTGPNEMEQKDNRKQKDFIRDFDRNNDGFVSLEEFPGPVEVFKRLDKNRDGIITKEEATADNP